MSFPTDVEFAESANILPIKKIAEKGSFNLNFFSWKIEIIPFEHVIPTF